MKSYYIIIAALSIGANLSHAQSDRFEESYAPVKKELKSWDPVRGEWLANSIVAVANQKAIPPRNFPESITPGQMLDLVPPATLNRIDNIAEQNSRDTVDRQTWSNIRTVVSRPSCSPVGGRTYGDPHLVSYDGARYSFQTVGEFVLTKASTTQFEVQSRQKAQNDNFSLNTAIAMNVNGDRVCIYAEDLPDNDRSTPVRVNGVAQQISSTPFFLSNGGMITRSGETYIVDWPTGEAVSAKIRRGSGMDFINVSLQVFPCSDRGFTGLMGNANGIERDDYETGTEFTNMAGTSNNSTAVYWKKKELAYLAQQFADKHRVTMTTTLFDYPIGTSTFTFTDRSFPRVHLTMDDMDPVRRNHAKRNCEQNGVSGRDLEGCIYDQGYMSIPPSRPVVITNPTDGMVLQKVDKPVLNTNESPFDKSNKTVNKDRIVIAQPIPMSQAPTPVLVPQKDKEFKQSIDTPVKDTDPIKSEPIKTEPIKTTPPKTIESPKPVVTPRPKVTPRPTTPRPKPSAPKPKPMPKSTPMRGGRL